MSNVRAVMRYAPRALYLTAVENAVTIKLKEKTITCVFLGACSIISTQETIPGGTLPQRHRNALGKVTDDLSPPSHLDHPCGTLAQGETGNAIAAYARAVELAPELAPARVNLGAQLLKHGRLQEAEQVRGRVITQQ